MKLIKINGYWIIVSDEEIKENNWFAHFFKDGFVGIAKITEKGLLDYPKYRKNWLKLIASQNPEHNLPTITFSDEVAKKLGIVEYMDFWENMPVRWVKWTKRQPNWNGSVWIQFNGKNQSRGLVHNKELYKLEGLDNSEFENYEDSFYWLEQDFDYRNQALSDNKDKLFTLEQIINLVETRWYAEIINEVYDNQGERDREKLRHNIKADLLQSLTKQEYEVELEIEYQNQNNKWSLYYPFASSAKTERPRITNNSVKVIKIIK